MAEERKNISRNTWARVVEPVNKIGYMDGAANGQSAVFQSSFDTGYEQGLRFGFELGLRKARMQQESGISDLNLRDPQHLNCQICINGTTIQENLVNLYNTQQEKNTEIIGK